MTSCRTRERCRRVLGQFRRAEAIRIVDFYKRRIVLCDGASFLLLQNREMQRVALLENERILMSVYD